NPVTAIAECGKPVIGAINGVAITGGFELALACDILLASEQARFADTHALVGIMPGWGLSQKLPRIIGLSRAKEMSLSGRFISADTAAEWGLVNRVYPEDTLLSEAIALAEDIAFVEPGMLSRYRNLIDDGAKQTLASALTLEHRVSSEWNRQVSSEDVEARRLQVMARGRAQQR
ncbi:MAG: enoyl-CoA hydratase-related protein, partial [Spongiibacter marinus]